jgi:hypothetical protein
MQLTPLATEEQLTARMSTPPDAERVFAALTDASAAVRAYTGQLFNRLETVDMLPAIGCGVIRLPQRPVNEVLAVTVGGDDVPWEFDGFERLSVLPAVVRAVVMYDHGYDPDEYPDDVVAVTCALAARALALGPEDAGISQRSITNYSESLGTVGASAPSGFFDAEKETLNRYRRPRTSIPTLPL